MDITLALGGGGSKGNAHIGVLRQLERAGFHICALAGTSFGGLVAVFYALGFSPDQIETIFADVDQSHLYDRVGDEGPSFLGLGVVQKWLETHLGDQTFADLKIPCALTAVDVRNSQEVVLRQGRLSDAVLATIAVPGIFPAFAMGDWELVDGGVLNPVPVELARSLAPSLPVFAVSLTPTLGVPPRPVPVPLPDGLPGPLAARLHSLRITRAFRAFMGSVDLASRQLTELRLQVERPDAIIRPDVAEFGLLERVDVRELVRRGEAAVAARLPELKRAANWTHRWRRQFRRQGP